MDAEFWQRIWAEGRTGFHLPEVNGALAGHIGALGLAPGARVFLPLCGKTRDAGWLRARGQRVLGVELSGLAVAALFRDLGLQPEVFDGPGGLLRHRAEGIEIWQGDLFALTPEDLGPVAATFDRAALFALPPGLRRAYADQVIRLTRGAPQLLVSFQQDGGPDRGPPFSVGDDELLALYGGQYDLQLLEEALDPPFRDSVWSLSPKV